MVFSKNHQGFIAGPLNQTPKIKNEANLYTETIDQHPRKVKYNINN